MMNDGVTPYTPRVNCLHCGRFVGRDGTLHYEYFEMGTLASLDGECGRCRDGTKPVPDWPTNRCAECGGTEGLVTHDVTVHPPLCPKCTDLWYPAVSDVGETDWLGP